jgi:hypothetical protein
VKRCLYLTFVLSAFGCSPSVATTGGVKVESADPPENCAQVSTITASASNTGNDDERVREKLRTQAAASGANYVRLDKKLEDSSTRKEYTGTAYKCPGGT